MTGIETGMIVSAGKTFIERALSPFEDKAKAKWQQFDWYTAQKYYLAKIEDDYGSTRILGKPAPIKLDGIFTDVYLLNKPTAYIRFDIDTLKGDPESISNQHLRESGLEIVKAESKGRLYILGKPGAGKTTFLKYIAVEASRGKIRKIPIFVSLKEWADSGLPLMSFLVHQFDICKFPNAKFLIEYLLDEGQAIVLFDGLDETKQDGGIRSKIIDQLQSFSRKYDKIQILITCRIAATDYSFDQFTYLEVADFNSDQVRIYVKKWFEDDKEAVDAFYKEFSKPENERLREMSNTPLLLSLLCLNFEETLTFPQRKVEIYDEAINALLHKWDAVRKVGRDEIYKGLSLGRKKQMFARIAFQTFENNEYFLPQDRLERKVLDYLCQLPDSYLKEDINGEEVLKSIESQHGIFVERARRIYSFSHLTFQEYFASKSIVDSTERNSLEALLRFANITDNRWREVILNTASLMDCADTYFEIFFESINNGMFLDFKLKSFLKWANSKATAILVPTNISAIRLFYCYLALLNEGHFNSDRSIAFSHILDRNHDSFLNLSKRFDLDYILGLTKDFDSAAYTKYCSIIELITKLDVLGHLNQKSELSMDLGLVLLNVALTISIKVSKIRLITTLIVKLEEIQMQLVKQAQEMGRRSLAADLAGVSFSVLRISSEQTESLTQRIQSILFKHSKIRNWEFTTAQHKTILEYFQCNSFLLECLDLASVSNRQMTRDKILDPL